MKFDLHERRIQLGLSLEDIGKKVGVSKSTVKKWESGFIENMKRDKIALLAEVLKVSPLDIIGVNTIKIDIYPHENWDNCIKCPCCGGDYVHFNSVVDITFDNEKSSGTALEFWCENDHYFHLIIESYKGNTFFMYVDDSWRLFSFDNEDIPVESIPISLADSYNEDRYNRQSYKYRVLDEHGMKVVDMVLNEEYERCNPAIKKITRPYYASSVSAGFGNPLDEPPVEEIEIEDTPEHRRGDFIVRVSGDSMESRYSNGDLVLVQKQPTINIGEIGIFILNGESFIKKLGINELISLNSKYPPRHFSNSDCVICCGKVLCKI